MNGNTAQGNGKVPFFDTVKALGIVAIVLGHCHPNADVVRFVYGFHLAIFLFVSGLQFNDEKYATAPGLLLRNRIASMWPGYFVYMTLFTLTSGLFLMAGMLAESYAYQPNVLFRRTVDNFFFRGSETLGGAMWFVPMMLSGLIVFSLILFLSAKLFGRFRTVSTVLLCGLCGFIGLYSCANGYTYVYYTHVALLLIPLICLGYLVSLYKIRPEKLFRWPVALLSLGLFVYLTVFRNLQVNLATGEVASFSLFYVITLSGIYPVCYLAKLLSKNTYTARAFSFLGRYSFDIMALHFLIMKTVDLIYGTAVGAAPEIVSLFPRAFPQLWPVYLAGVTLPPLIRILFNRLWTWVRSLPGRKNF